MTYWLEKQWRNSGKDGFSFLVPCFFSLFRILNAFQVGLIAKVLIGLHCFKEMKVNFIVSALIVYFRRHVITKLTEGIICFPFPNRRYLL